MIELILVLILLGIGSFNVFFGDIEWGRWFLLVSIIVAGVFGIEKEIDKIKNKGEKK